MQWAAPLYKDLRHALIQGQITLAEEVSAKIEGHMLEEEAQNKVPRRSSLLHHEAVATLVAAITAIQERDAVTGLMHLRKMPDDPYLNKSLRWVTRYWTALAYRYNGKIKESREVMESSLELAGELDTRSRSISLYGLAEIEYLSRRYPQALQTLEEVGLLYATIKDKRGMASARLMQARIEAAQGNADRASFIGLNALVLDPSYAQPVIFLGRQAIQNAKFKQAEKILNMLERLNPKPPEVERDRALMVAARILHIPVRSIRQYLIYEESLPSEEVIEGLAGIIGETPDFLQAREVLAWKLLQLGRSEEANKHFKFLVQKDLEPELMSSVKLGLAASTTMASRSSASPRRLAEAVHSGDLESRGADRGSRERPRVERPERPKPERPDRPRLERPERPGPERLKPERSERPDRPRPELMTTVRSATAAAHPSVADTAGSMSLHDVLERDPSVVLRGGLQHLAIPELLQFFSGRRMSGTLVVASDRNIGAVQFRQGQICGGMSPGCGTLGELLVKEANVSRFVVDRAMKMQEQTRNRLLGDILLEHRMADAEAMKKALTRQVYNAIRELMSWREGDFAFTPRTVESETPSGIQISLDPPMVLLDIMRLIDEEKENDSQAHRF